MLDRRRIKPVVRTPEIELEIPDYVKEAVRTNRRYVPLEQKLEEEQVPEGFFQHIINFENEQSYFALVPERINVYMAYPNAGDDELWDCYQEIKDYEKELIKERKLNVAESYFAQGVREAYEIHVLNQVIANGKIRKEFIKLFGEGPVISKVNGMVALLLGNEEVKTLKGQSLDDILVHINGEITDTHRSVETVERKEQYRERVYCRDRSHYEYKTKTRTIKKNVTTSHTAIRQLDLTRTKTLYELENEIVKDAYGVDMNKQEFPHRVNLLRTYVNLILEKEGKQRLPLIMGFDEVKEYETITKSSRG